MVNRGRTLAGNFGRGTAPTPYPFGSWLYEISMELLHLAMAMLYLTSPVETSLRRPGTMPPTSMLFSAVVVVITQALVLTRLGTTEHL